MLNFCEFIQVYVFTTNHHLKPPSIHKIKCVHIFAEIERSFCKNPYYFFQQKCVVLFIYMK